MSTEQAGSVVIQVNAQDFERLCENSGKWAGLNEPLGRFEGLDSGEPPSFREWRSIYWLGDNYTTVIFARAFLAARGFDYEILWDTAGPVDGPMFGWCILTDYEEPR